MKASRSVFGTSRGGGQSIAGQELKRRSQVLGQCIFLENLGTETARPPDLVKEPSIAGVVDAIKVLGVDEEEILSCHSLDFKLM